MPQPPFRHCYRNAPLALVLLAVAIAVFLRTAVSDAAPVPATSPPATLRDTGLYRDGPGLVVDPAHLAFSPQYPLWTDGALKRRWLSLPPNTSIDASRPNAWEFPIGTRLWKEFSVGRAVETRYIERLTDGSWRYASYIWNEAGTDATLAPINGVRALAIDGAPNNRYTVPGEADCRACHEGAAAPVLGFSALQLSHDRDPLAPHADALSPVDLRQLVARGLVRNLPQALLDAPPRIAASSPYERAALGYLHGNCGHCHNADGSPVPVELRLSQDVSLGAQSPEQVLRSLIDAPSRFRAAGLAHDARVVAPGRPEASTLLWRIRSMNPQTQMPPLGVQALDHEALALLERWITERSSLSLEQ
jgi:mono/diheme cytochrome c family protein